jgi:hypothetical protein
MSHKKTREFKKKKAESMTKGDDIYNLYPASPGREDGQRLFMFSKKN